VSDRSAIEWTDATWNPVRGCDKVSPGCKHCYAEVFAERWRGVPGHPFEQGFDLRLVPEALSKPLGWRAPRRIFVNSMSDLFHEDIPDDYIGKVFDVMASCPQHQFQLLTKRAARMFEWVNDNFHPHLPNVWVGVSVENQKYADERIPYLMGTPAAVRFLSIEPLLGPVLLGEAWDPARINWVIVGGESGAGAREMKAEWVRSLRDECVAAGVAFFFKQWGGVRKKIAGRTLDGRTWDAFPSPPEGHPR
jgi:protein gp37